MLSPNQLALLASCIEIGLEGAEAPEDDIEMVSAMVRMIRGMMPVVEENGAAILPLLGPDEASMIDYGLRRLAGDEVRVPAASWQRIRTFSDEWKEMYGEVEAPTQLH